ncbi:MAG: hypothetical protein ACTHLX_15435, partial [Candidatus Binatia bacterium]
ASTKGDSMLIHSKVFIAFRLPTALTTALLLLFFAGAQAAETPRSGGELVFAVGEIPPSFDGHRETTFGMLHPVAPHYSTLLRFDPQN